MTTGSRRLTVQRLLAQLQTSYQSSTGIAALSFWFELASDFQTSLLKFKINMEHPPSKREREHGGERWMQSRRKSGGHASLHPDDPESWVSLKTIILSVPSKLCPRRWHSGPAGSLQFVERLPPARGLWIGSLKHFRSPLLVVKYFVWFCKYIFLQRHRHGVLVAQQVICFALRLSACQLRVLAVVMLTDLAKVYSELTLQQTTATPVIVPVYKIWPDLRFLLSKYIHETAYSQHN